MKKIVPGILIFSAMILVCSCSNEDTKTNPPTDSTATAQNGKGQIDSSKQQNDSTTSMPSKITANSKDSLAMQNNTAIEKTKKNAAALSDHTKKILHKTDSAANLKSAEAAASKKESTTSTDEKLVPASVADNSKAFAPKYGLIPRDATENNITSFKNAFPDKQTLVKINYDADPDAEMQAVRTQIITALKKSGYTNISDKSTTFHPTRMPKDIHYELQRDGSVIIWLQPATTDQ